MIKWHPYDSHGKIFVYPLEPHHPLASCNKFRFEHESDPPNMILVRLLMALNSNTGVSAAHADRYSASPCHRPCPRPCPRRRRPSSSRALVSGDWNPQRLSVRMMFANKTGAKPVVINLRWHMQVQRSDHGIATPSEPQTDKHGEQSDRTC